MLCLASVPKGTALLTQFLSQTLSISFSVIFDLSMYGAIELTRILYMLIAKAITYIKLQIL